MDPAGIPALGHAIRDLHGCASVFVEWVFATDMVEGKTVFEREVGVFELLGHRTAQRAYAWSEPGIGTARRFFVVLHSPEMGVIGPLAAVRASLVADARRSLQTGRW